MSKTPERLLVIVPDRITDILIKGEYQPNYYNPGELFPEVHLLTITDDRPDMAALQRTVGRAKLHLHNLPDDGSLVGGQWKRWWKKPLRDWARPGVQLARSIRPQLIRCHGADWNTYLASQIKERIGIPYVVSLHINADVNPPRRHLGDALTPAQRAHNEFYEFIEATGLRGADLVMPVYKSILPYLHRLGVERVQVCYNVLNGAHLRTKTDYALHGPLKVLYVGRLVNEKNPKHIIDAVARIPGATLTIVGDGTIRADLEAQVAALAVGDRVRFEPALPNDVLCARLPEFDVFAIHTEYWELSKSLLEALLTGLPVIINRRIGDQVPELVESDIVRFVDNTAGSYFDALSALAASREKREALGRRAFAHAQANWSPATTEAAVVDVYRRFMRA
jgi:glycosyltransferase involved in cell wall biosynthesis